MYLILKKLRPMIGGNPAAFAMLILVAMLGMSVLIGISGSYQILKGDFDQFYDEYGYPDITLTFSATPRSSLPDISTLDGVADAGFRLVLDAQIQKDDGQLITSRITGLNEASFLSYQTLEARERKDGEEGPAIYMSPKLMEHNGFRVGDTPRLRDMTGAYRQVYLEKSISSPEYLYVMRNPFSWHDDADFGYAFMELEDMQTFFKSGEAVNQCIIRLRPEADADVVLKNLKERLEPYRIISALTFRESATYKGMNAVLKPIKAMSTVLPVAFYGAAMLITYMFLRQHILRQRGQIGILRALGVSRGNILALYCSYALASTLLASILGGALGIALARITAGVNRDFFYLPDYGHYAEVWTLLLAALLTNASGVVPTLISCYKIAGISPSVAMREEPPTTHKAPFLVRTLFRNASELPKLIISLTLRNRKRLILSVITTTLSIVLIIIALSFTLSKNYILDNYYNNRNQFQSQTYFSRIMPSDIVKEWEAWEEVGRCEPVLTGLIELEHGGLSKEALLYGFSLEATLIRLQDAQRRPLAIRPEGIILEENTASGLGVGIGDRIQAVTRDKAGKVRRVEVEVSGIAMESVNYIQYCSLVQAEEILSGGDSGGISKTGGENAGSYSGGINSVVTTLAVEDEKPFIKRLAQIPYIDYTFFASSQRPSAEKTIAQMDIPAWIINAFAILMGFVVIYNTSRISFFERRKQFASLRAFGFQTSEIIRNTFIEAGVQFILATAVGLPAGHLVSKIFLKQIRSDVMSYPFVNRWSTYAMAAGLVFLFTVVGHAWAVSGMGRINLTETLKDRGD